jgi:small subunit ribosomal protein S9
MNATATQDRAIYWGTGRRKSSIARVRLVPGAGKVIVNDRSGEDYFNRIPGYLAVLKSPLETLGLENEYDIIVNAHGGGLTGQADAVKLGVARALCELDPDNRQPLKIEGYLTRDPRCKERKKYGLHKARKAPQFSKR